MVIIISPSKTQKITYSVQKLCYTLPEYLEESSEIVSFLKQKNEKELSLILGISQKLALLNSTRYQNFKLPFSPKNSTPAILTYQGDVYQGIEIKKYKSEDFEFAQSRLRIISGLYGILRPLDLIQTYRLEMGAKLRIGNYKNLYTFWQDKITKFLKDDLVKNASTVLINLASLEYNNAVNFKELKVKIITPVFKDYKNGKYQVIGINAKKARGKMADYIIKNKITNPEKIKEFAESGYLYNPSESSANIWVFSRNWN